ncbi:hypothetical protein ACFV1L_16700 [Kitasatospora sp. NPDC059646]|uniref:hypothetical protein n=1 Tax=Kitasatospora sp. NPDC059646 TaxID=3346893 RepID=UPI0036B1A4DB
MLIKGYGPGPLVEGERLLGRAGFWSNHLLPMCRFVPGEDRPEPEWFGDDGADADALAEVLLDDRAWPVFRVPFGGGHRAVVAYRNLVGDPGTDYLLDRPEWPRAARLAGYDGDWYGPGLSWRDLAHLADTPDPDSPGVHDGAARLLLLLPLLADDEVPPEAPARVSAALTAVGAPDGSARDTADHLLRNRRPAAGPRAVAGSPLSGGDHRRTAPGPVASALTLTRPQRDALADALGSRPQPGPPRS